MNSTLRNYHSIKILTIRLLEIIFLLFFLCPTFAFQSQNANIQIGRYLDVSTKPLRDQQNPLQQCIQVYFPNNIQTLDQAIQFILQFRGYHLADRKNQSKALKTVLAQPLPEADRKLGPITLQEALTTLVGDPFYLLFDPIHRMVSFELKSEYKKLYFVKQSKSDSALPCRNRSPILFD